MQRSASNAARRRVENQNYERDIAGVIEAELISAKNQQQPWRQRRSFVEDRPSSFVPERKCTGASLQQFVSPKSARLIHQSRQRVSALRADPRNGESLTSDECDEDELEAAVVGRRPQQNRLQSNSVGSSDDSDVEGDENSWSNKKFAKRLMNGEADYDMIRATPDAASMGEEKENQAFNDEMANVGAAVFHHSSRPNAKLDSSQQENFDEEQQREWMRIMQQQLHQNRQKANLDASKDQSDQFVAHEQHGDYPNKDYPEMHGKHFEPAGHCQMVDGPKMDKPTPQKQKQPKTLSFAPQNAKLHDGRPPLPLDAKKLQQQQAAAQRQRQKVLEKTRRFPAEEMSNDGKKKMNGEMVPEMCRLHVLQWIENGTRRFLWHLGRRLTSVPTLTVVLPLIVCALSTVGVIIRRDSLRWDMPFHTFYYPEADFQNSPFSSNGNQQVGQGDFFNASNPRYDAFRTGSSEGGGSEFSVILKTEDHNVLEEEAIDSYLRLRKKLEDIKVVSGQKIFKYQMLCRRTQRDSCQKDVVETLMSSGKTIKFHYPETTISTSTSKRNEKTDKTDKSNNTSTFFIGNTFGGVETDQDGSMAKAEALAMYFKLKPPPKSETKDSVANGVDVLRAWDDEFQRLMRDEELAHSRGKAGAVSWWSYGAFAAEVLSTFNKVYVYLAASLAVFGVGCVAASFRCDSYSSKPGLGLAAVITIVLIIGGGWCVEIGITGYVNPAIFPAFFFIAATALHFMINALQSWRKYSAISMDPGERTRIILCWDLPCLLWCCLILVLSYVITAAVATLPYYRSVSQFLAASSLLTAVLVLLLFVGAMYLSGKRESAGLKWFQCGQKITAEFPPPFIRRYHMRDVQLLQKKMRDEENQPLRSLGQFAANVHARYVALLIFCIYLIFAAWGCSLAPIRISERQYIKPSTNLYRFLDDYNQYYGRYDNYLVLTFHDSIDYFDSRTRSAILDMLGWVETQERVAERTVSWLRDFTEFEKSSIYLINRDTFVPVVDLIFLKEGSPYQKYAADIAFGRYREQIIASKMYIELNSVGSQRQLEVIKTLSAKAAEAGLPLSIRSPTLFLLHHDVQIATATITAMIVLIGMIGLLTFFIFAQPYLTVLTVLTTVSVTVGTIGLTALWDVPINALNIGTVLAAVIHSAALCISCCYQYGNSGDSTSVRRMAFTFQSWLPGAVWSSAIGLAAFAPLLFIECQIIQHLAKIVLCHFVSILIHVVVFLPPCLVVLTTSVPTCCKFVKGMCEESCCLCCSSDEDATSIYYIPTGGRPLDPTYVQQFYQLKFREDILPQTIQPLPPPPVREMLMPPPPRGPPSSVAGSAAHMHHPEQRCTSPPAMLDSRLHSARSSMRRQAFGNAPNAAAKVYRYGSNNADFEEIMRARTARAAVTKRHMSPDICDPSHRSRRASPDVASPRNRRRSATASPLAERTQHLDAEEIYHEPSDPDSISMRTTNTNDFNKPTNLNSSTSPPGAAIESADEEESEHGKQKGLKPYDSRLVEADGTTGGPPKSKITYAKWSKEIPLDPFTTERVTAEKYTIEGDGATIDLPPDWKRYWIKGNLRRQGIPPNAHAAHLPPDVVGMAPPGDHHVPMHAHPPPMAMPTPGVGPRFRSAPPQFHHPPPTADGPPMMMPPYGAPPPLPPRPPPYGLPPRTSGMAYKGQQQSNFRKTPAWMY